MADRSSGLLSLVVEFFRVNTSSCPTDDNGNPTSLKNFPYGNITCGLTCDTIQGPFSPLRKGSANNIYVIPAPQKLTVDTATLFAAGCCIPAILSLPSMWNKILEINWKDRFGNRNKEEEPKQPSEEKDGAELRQSKTAVEASKNADLKKMNEVIRFFLTAVEIPVFGAAVLAILIIGEWNFWSPEVSYQTEPIKAIGKPPFSLVSHSLLTNSAGQWAPIAGTALAVIGSIYILATTRGSKPPPPNEAKAKGPEHHCCDCLAREGSRGRRRSATPRSQPRSPPHSGDIGEASARQSISPNAKGSAEEIETKRHSLAQEHVNPVPNAEMEDAGYRRTIAKGIFRVFRSLGTAAPDMFDDSGFKAGESGEYPATPGEDLKNSKLGKTMETFRKIRKADTHYGTGGETSFAASGPSNRPGS